MRGSWLLIGILLSASASMSQAQETLCNPCVDAPAPVPVNPLRRLDAPDSFESVRPLPDRSGPDTFSNVPERPTPSGAHISPRRIADLIRASGGELSSLTHECGNIVRETFGGTDWMVSACRWGGRYPALLIEPAAGNDLESVFVVAVTGNNAYELLIEEREPSAAASDLRDSSVEELEALVQRAHSAAGP